MTPGCSQLFEYARRQVTAEDVSDFCPGDPGTADYVREFKTILKSGVLPTAWHFDVTETITLTWWGDADRGSDPNRFRRFRVFVNSVGMAMCSGPEGAHEIVPPIYLCIGLLDDAYALKDSELLGLLFPAFQELHMKLSAEEWFAGESLFFLLGQLVLAFLGAAPSANIGSLCEQLIFEESLQRRRASREFLWGCTNYDQMHHRLKRLVELSFPRTVDDPVALLRDILLSPA